MYKKSLTYTFMIWFVIFLIYVMLLFIVPYEYYSVLSYFLGMAIASTVSVAPHLVTRKEMNEKLNSKNDIISDLTSEIYKLKKENSILKEKEFNNTLKN